MNVRYLTINKPASPEYVLAVLRDDHRQQCQYDPEAEPEISLSFDSTIADWRHACDLVPWRRLGRALNDRWDIRIPDRVWREVLEPANEKTLEGVCRLIATYARRPVIRPARMCGAECETAGAFLTIRSLLHECGVCAEHIRPSTPLASYARRYTGVFLGPVARLAPGAVPLINVHAPLYDAIMWGIPVGFVFVVAGLIPTLRPLASLGVMLWFLSCLSAWIAVLFIPPKKVTFGEVETFGDLARVIVGTRDEV